MVVLVLCWLTIIISLFVSVGGKLHWLDFLYVASYVKLAITLLKYIPQVCHPDLEPQFNDYHGPQQYTEFFRISCGCGLD